MPISVKIIGIICASAFFMVFIMLVKNRSVKPFYSCLWFFVSVLMFSIIVFEKLFKWLALFFGLTDASFLVIVGVIFFLLMYILHLSIRLSEMSDQIQELISHLAIIEKKIFRDEDDFFHED